MEAFCSTGAASAAISSAAIGRTSNSNSFSVVDTLPETSSYVTTILHFVPAGISLSAVSMPSIVPVAPDSRLPTNTSFPLIPSPTKDALTLYNFTRPVLYRLQVRFASSPTSMLPGAISMSLNSNLAACCTGIARLEAPSYCTALPSSYFIVIAILYGFCSKSARAFISMVISLVSPAGILSR